MSRACYASYGPLGWLTGRLEPESRATPTQFARAEAAEIDALSGRLPLRLHTSGDCRTPAAARIVAAAARRYTARHGKSAFGYTHSWKSVARSDWSGVSMLASCEKVSQLAQAHARGFSPALVVESFERSSAYPVGDGTFKVLPCPEMTRDDVTCSSCQLCFDDARLHERRLVIGFSVHGPGRRHALPILAA